MVPEAWVSQEQIAALTAERDRLNPFALSAAIEAKVAAILRMPSGSAGKSLSPRTRAMFTRTYSAGGARRDAAQEAAPVRAPVRNNVAR